MNTESPTVLTLDDINAMIARARSDRAEGIRELMSKLPAQLRRLMTRLRPNRRRLPQSGIEKQPEDLCS